MHCAFNSATYRRIRRCDTILRCFWANISRRIESGLVETILDDVGDEPGSLPLLEFLLETLWKERRGALLHYDAYQKLGWVAGAIAHRADEVFTRELDDNQREAAQRLLIRRLLTKTFVCVRIRLNDDAYLIFFVFLYNHSLLNFSPVPIHIKNCRHIQLIISHLFI
jgi:Novel STAND NTPase 1